MQLLDNMKLYIQYVYEGQTDRWKNASIVALQYVKHLNTLEQHMQKKVYTTETGMEECPLHYSKLDR